MKSHLKLIVALWGMVLSAIIYVPLSAFAATPGQSTLPQLSAVMGQPEQWWEKPAKWLEYD